MAVQSVKELTVYKAIEEHSELVGLCTEIGKMLGSMIQRPEPFLLLPGAALRSLPLAS